MPTNLTRYPNDAMEDEMHERTTVAKANLSTNHVDKYSPCGAPELGGHYRRNLSVMKTYNHHAERVLTNQDEISTRLSARAMQRCSTTIQAKRVLEPAWKQCFERLAKLQLSFDAVREDHMILQQFLNMEKLTRELEKARERLDRDDTELQRLKYQSRSGCFKNFLMVVSLVGFVLFLGVAVSGGAFFFARGDYQGWNHGLS